MADKYCGWVDDGTRVRAREAFSGGTMHVGIVRAYSAAPMVLIVTDDGRREWWRADLCEAVSDEDVVA